MSPRWLVVAALASEVEAFATFRMISPPRPLFSLRGGGEATGMNLAVVAEQICPTVGVFVSTALYCAPGPAVVNAVRNEDIGELNPVPWPLILLSTLAWIQFALSIRNPFVVASNFPGAVAAVAFVAFGLPLMKKEDARAVQLTLTAGVLGSLSLWTYLIFAKLPSVAVSAALGNYAVVFCVLLFASPLSTIRKVFATKSAVSIYAPMTAAQCANCGLWTAYGLAVKNAFVWGPNLTGLLLGFVQLALKVVFRG